MRAGGPGWLLMFSVLLFAFFFASRGRRVQGISRRIFQAGARKTKGGISLALGRGRAEWVREKQLMCDELVERVWVLVGVGGLFC